MNRMSVSQVYTRGELFDFRTQAISNLPKQFHELVEFAMLASQPDPFDPMDRAIRKIGEEALCRTEHIHTGWKIEREYPLSQNLLAISEVWASPDSSSK
jgi:P-type Ca2+ transporter type 2C